MLVMYIGIALLFEVMVKKPKFRKRFLIGLGGVILTVGLSFGICYLVRNIINHQYKLSVYFDDYVPNVEDSTLGLYHQNFDTLFYARNDSAAKSKIRPFIMEKAKEWYTTEDRYKSDSWDASYPLWSDKRHIDMDIYLEDETSFHRCSYYCSWIYKTEWGSPEDSVMHEELCRGVCAFLQIDRLPLVIRDVKRKAPR